MKRVYLFLLSAFLLTSCGILFGNSNASMSYCTYVDGYWGNWKYFHEMQHASFYGTPGNFIVYQGHGHKSNYSIKIDANNCYLSSKDKAAIRSHRWYEYKGYITYRDVRNRSSKEYVRNFNGSLLSFSDDNEIRRPATIKIYPKRDGYVYNIYFDGVGLALNIPWQIAK